MEEIIISVIRLLIILIFFVCLSPKQLFATNSNETDYESLVAFKNQFLMQSNGHPPAIFMRSWNGTNHFCSWEGVSCGHKHRDRVITLDLNSSGLVGFLPPCVANFTFLKRLDLSYNNLHGEIPPNLSHLQRLQYLNLSFNSLSGDISANLMMNHSSVLQVLDLSSNQFITGKIPHVITSRSSLSFLGLGKNNIIGTIPPSLGNLSFLESLYLFYNHLEGGIPLEIGGLRKLKNFNVADNNLSGNIPYVFYNLSSLRRVSVTNNLLSGNISANIAQSFPNLEIFYFAENNFTGSLDQALQNATSLVLFDVSKNKLTGVVPPYLGKMNNLIRLNMADNQFEASDAEDWRFLDSLTNCTNLQILGLHGNNLHGMLPKSFGNLSITLQEITLGSNHISGSIPFELGRYINLIGFGMEENLLEGIMPESVGKLRMLQILSFEENNLVGIIPSSIGNLTSLNLLTLNFNQLTGPIPLSISNLQILAYLDLSHNHLTGQIPREIFFIHSLSNELDLSHNALTGLLPLEVGHLINLMSLDLSNNNLTGGIPESLGSCELLLELYMERNFFDGPIPISLSDMKSLEILDLSYNNLSGVIPQSLQKLIFLKSLNLSFNNLEGEVPYEGVFANSSAISLIGNDKICGGISELHFPKCSVKSSSRKSNYQLIKILTPIFGMLVMLFVFLWFYTLLCRKQKRSYLKSSSDSSLNTPFPKISYSKLANATNDFSATNLVGFGRHGSVYRGNLIDYPATVAIKVFNVEVLGAFKSFTNECEILRSIRHRNLIRVLSSCSSIDLQGRDFKALIFEFMPKGNLDMWLHHQYEIDGDNFLSLEKRLNIAIDVTDALEYLHHGCESSIIHYDIKPSNILLDNDMIAHVGDFGLSKMLAEIVSVSHQNHSNRSEIKGTLGYIAPEYSGAARSSISADVYSFGIILLEMLTGRRPTDDIFKDNLNLYNHVKMAFPHRINDIVDLKIFTKEQRDGKTSNGEEARRFYCKSVNNCLCSLAEVGLACSALSPEERPSMRDVNAKLHAIRVSYLQSIQSNGDEFLK